jgi:EAL domain-containing protein (putative c-di-GMP-specific phosphodiesterase class I)
MVPIALNLSINQFRQKNQFLKMLAKVFDEFKIDYNRLEFEITESILMNGNENISILKSIQKMGIKISFDDFGIGYSSFNYLKYFTPNRVKLDKSFIDGIPNVPSSVAIIKAIITLCKSLDIKTTAEGAETEEQLKFLIDQGCDEVQSFYFSRPLPISEASKIIENDFKDLIPLRK